MEDKNKVKIVEDLEYEINIKEKKKKDDKETRKESDSFESNGAGSEH